MVSCCTAAYRLYSQPWLELLAASTQVCQWSGHLDSRWEILRVRTNVTKKKCVREEKKEREGEAEGEKTPGWTGRERTLQPSTVLTPREVHSSPLLKGPFQTPGFPSHVSFWTLCPFPEVLCFRTGAYESLRAATQALLTVCTFSTQPRIRIPTLSSSHLSNHAQREVRVYCSQLSLAQSACFWDSAPPQHWEAVGDIKSVVASNASFALEQLNDPGQAL